MQERMITNNSLHGPILVHLKYTFGAVLILRDSTSARKRSPSVILPDTTLRNFKIKYTIFTFRYHIAPTTPKILKPHVPFRHICVTLFLAFKKEGRPLYHKIYGQPYGAPATMDEAFLCRKCERALSCDHTFCHVLFVKY